MEVSFVEGSFNIIKYQNGTYIPCSEVSFIHVLLYNSDELFIFSSLAVGGGDSVSMDTGDNDSLSFFAMGRKSSSDDWTGLVWLVSLFIEFRFVWLRFRLDLKYGEVVDCFDLFLYLYCLRVFFCFVGSFDILFLDERTAGLPSDLLEEMDKGVVSMVSSDDVGVVSMASVFLDLETFFADLDFIGLIGDT